MKNLIFFGPPGAGKGTQAKQLVETFKLLHISTGDLFRYEIGNSTPLGLEAKSFIDKGELVPDSVTIGMLKNKVQANPDVPGYIFDGFPRTINQAKALDVLMTDLGTSIDKLIMLDVPEKELIDRLLKRGESSGRADDQNEEVIKNRLKVYEDNTAPVFHYYEQQGKGLVINGLGEIDEVFARLSAEVDKL